MRLNFHLKLGIGIIVVFGLLLAGYYVYEPLWFKVQKWRLVSEDAAARKDAVSALAGKCGRALPYLCKWLKSRDEKLLTGCCQALRDMEGSAWEDALPELERILYGRLSPVTDAAAEVLVKHPFIKKHYYKSDFIRRRNVAAYIIRHSEDIGTCRDAAWTLADICDKTSIDVLVGVLENNSNENIRREVAEVLGTMYRPRAVKALANALLVEINDFVRRSVAVALCSGNVTPAAYDALVHALKNDTDESVRLYAAHALGSLRDKRALKTLCEALKDPDPNVRESAAKALGKIPNRKAIPVLLEALKSEEYYGVVRAICETLGRIQDKRAIKPIINLLNRKNYDEFKQNEDLDIDILSDEDVTYHDLQEILIRALGRIGGKESMRVLAEVFIRDEENTGGQAADALGVSIHSEAQETLHNIMETANSAQTRLCAAVELGRNGDSRAIKTFIKEYNALISVCDNEGCLYIDDKISISIYDVSCALREIDDPRAVEFLVSALTKSKNWLSTDTIITNLGVIGKRSAVEPLISVFENTGKKFISESSVIEALGNIGGPRAADWLYTQLEKEKQREFRDGYIDALVNARDKRVIDVLLTDLNTPGNSSIRMKVLKKLYKFGDNSASGPVCAVLENDSDARVRAYAATVLRRIGGPGAVDSLIRALKSDPKERVRVDAAFSLGVLGDRRAIEPLIHAMQNDTGTPRRYHSLVHDPTTRAASAIALSILDWPGSKDAIEDARMNLNDGAEFAFAWHLGPKEFNRTHRIANEHWERWYTFWVLSYDLLKIKWGDIESCGNIRNIIMCTCMEINYGSPRIDPYYKLFPMVKEVLTIMPEGFPHFDFHADWEVQNHQHERMWRWLKKYKHLIRWDKNKRQYFLETEK
jgi:HEAT repeat protein